MTLTRLNNMHRVKACIDFIEKELKGERIADTTCGSMPVFPYILHTTVIEGYTESAIAASSELMNLRFEYEVCKGYIANIDNPFLRNIFELRFIKWIKWNRIADSIGGNNTEYSIKKMVYRYIDSH